MGLPMAKKKQTGIAQAVERAGGQRPLSAATGIAKSYIHRMYHAGVVPPTQCKKISAVTGVPLELLNPEIYG